MVLKNYKLIQKGERKMTMTTMKEIEQMEPGEILGRFILGCLMFYFFWCRFLFCGNFWSMNEENILREVRSKYSEYVKVINIDKNWYDYSEATLETAPDPITGETKKATFVFNSNIIQEVSLVQEKY